VTESLAAALAAFQADLPAIKKTKTADVPTKSGGKYSYGYAGLAEVAAIVLPLLGKHGLSFTAKPTLIDGRFVLAYRLLHTSGEYEEGFYPLPSSGSAQEYGSAITYARRYALCSVVGVAAEDDDDGAAANHRRSHVRESYVDPAEQQQNAEDLLLEIEQAADGTALENVGRAVKKALSKREITQTQYARLIDAGAARRAGLDQDAAAGVSA
jgi:hypothetical protein